MLAKLSQSGKRAFDYVIRRFIASSVGLKKARRGGSTLRHRLARSPDPTGAPSQPKGGRFSKRLVRMVPGSTRSSGQHMHTKSQTKRRTTLDCSVSGRLPRLPLLLQPEIRWKG